MAGAGVVGGRIELLKHALVFAAAVALIWFAGALPGMLSSQPSSTPPQSPGAVVMGLLSAWPILIALAICQALTFHYVKKWTTPIFLTGVFALSLLMAWRYATTYV